MSEADARTMMIYDIKKKSMVLAYLFWLFLGSFGAHRFYLGRTGSAIVMLCLSLVSSVLTVVFIGFLGLAVVGIWWLIDAFLVYSMVNEHNLRLAEQLA